MKRTLSSPPNSRVLLDGKSVINLASNNYLGLAADFILIDAAQNALKQFGVGPGAGRTIVGNYSLHERLEALLASYKEVEATLVFNSGYMANLGAITSLVGKGDYIFSDALNHASLIDGCRLSGAKVLVYEHLDMGSLAQQLEIVPAGEKKLIVTDCVFSMDGDIAPLPNIVTLAKKHSAMVLADDAHGDGVLGKNGRGTIDHFGLQGQIDVETGSLSKAIGAVGGYIAADREIIDLMWEKARTNMFTASPLPVSMAAAAAASIEHISKDDSRLKQLWTNREYFAERLTKIGYNIGGSKTPIIPVIVKETEKANQLCEKLYELGVFAQAIAYPVVPTGQARLRTIISAHHSHHDLDEALMAFEQGGKTLGLI